MHTEPSHPTQRVISPGADHTGLRDATPEPKDDLYYIELIGKTLAVLEAFAHASQRQLTLGELSQQLQMNKNAVFRILYSLARHGYVVKDHHKYELGPKLVELSNARMRHIDLLSVAEPLLRALRDRFDETVNLGVLDHGAIRYIGVWESHDRLRLAEKVGAADMLHSSALGKAYLSCLSTEEVRALVGSKHFPAPTQNTITSLASLKIELAAIQQQGYAVDAEESMIGACCVACAIRDSGLGNPVASVSISSPIVRMTPERITEIGDALKMTVAEIQKQLGSTR